MLSAKNGSEAPRALSNDHAAALVLVLEHHFYLKNNYKSTDWSTTHQQKTISSVKLCGAGNVNFGPFSVFVICPLVPIAGPYRATPLEEEAVTSSD